jgi:hypothetical protein
MSVQNWIQLLIPLLIIFGPIAAKAFQKFGEVKKERERQARAQRAQIEALRTGQAMDSNTAFQPSETRGSVASAPPPQLNRPILSRSPSPAARPAPRPVLSAPRGPVSGSPASRNQLPRPGTTPTRVLRLPGGLTIEVPIEPDSGQPTSAPANRPAPTQAQAQAQAKRQQTKQQRPRKPQPQAPTSKPAEPAQSTPVFETVRGAAVSAATAQAAFAAPGSVARASTQPTTGQPNGQRASVRSSGLGALLPKNATPADVRKAFVLSEVFGTPVGGR